MLKLFKNFTKKEWGLMLVCFVLIFAQVWLELKMPDYMSEITVLVQTEGSKMADILKNGAYMLLCAFGSLVGAVIVGYLVSGLSATFSLRTRKQLFNKVEEMSMQEIKQFSTSSLITRTTNDITQVEMLIAMGLQLLIICASTIYAVKKLDLTLKRVVISLPILYLLFGLFSPPSIYLFVFTDKWSFFSVQHPAMPSWKASIFITVQYGIVMLITTLIACRKKCASDQK